MGPEEWHKIRGSGGGRRNFMLKDARRKRIVSSALSVAAALTLVLFGGVASAAEPGQANKSPKRDVLAVSNNWDGTVDLVNPHNFRRLERINVAPDYDQRFAEILLSPDRLAFFIAIRNQIGEGHDQLADDAFTSPDGRFLYVSRPSLADVVAINMRTERIKWRTPVEGYRSDHMAISENGRRLLVSASTANKVHVINTRRGKIVDEFPSGDSPHENNFSDNGRRIFHASIGMVYTPLDDPKLDSTKGERYFQIVDARTMEIRRRLNMGKVLEEAGFPDMSAAVRPMTLSPNERFLYFQVSFFHGFVEYDLKRDKVKRVVNLPQSKEARNTPREQYLLDSAHHGIDLNPRGTKLCIAGTMSDYAAIVRRTSARREIIKVGEKPYWSTSSENGRYCFVSVSGEDRVAVISYRRERELASIPVGDHPQRMRTGVVQRGYVR
jgi:DNA-binding beta-propeller fold protein YncE